MSRSRSLRLFSFALASLLSFGILALVGCGESPPAAKKTDQTAPAPVAPSSTKTAKGKGKNLNPTSDMDRDEVRAFRKQQAGQAKPQ